MHCFANKIGHSEATRSRAGHLGCQSSESLLTFPQRLPPSLLTTAACGGLKSRPDCRTPRPSFISHTVARRALRMQATPIQARAAVQMALRTPTESKKAATIPTGVLSSQSREVRTLPSVMIPLPPNNGWLPRLRRRALPASAGTAPNQMNRRRSNRPAWAAAAPHSRCIHKRTGRHRSASFLIWPWNSADR